MSSREGSGGVSVVDPTEIRWFVSGELPRDVRFAAHGPLASRLASVRTAWQALVLAGAPTIDEVGLDRGESMGYPEWLGRRCR